MVSFIKYCMRKNELNGAINLIRETSAIRRSNDPPDNNPVDLTRSNSRPNAYFRNNPHRYRYVRNKLTSGQIKTATRAQKINKAVGADDATSGIF